MLLLSGEDLRRRSLSDSRLSLPPCEQSAIRAGQVERRALAGIEYLTALRFSLGISPSSCANHSGFVVKIDRVNDTSVLGHQGAGDPPHELAQATLRMQSAVQPQEVVSTMRLGNVAVASDARPRLIDLDFSPPQTASLIDGKAIAPINAPPAIQAMIAAANHIDHTVHLGWRARLLELSRL